MQRYGSQTKKICKKNTHQNIVNNIVQDIERAAQAKAEADAVDLLWEGEGNGKKFLERSLETILPKAQDLVEMKRNLTENKNSERKVEAFLVLSDLSQNQMALSDKHQHKSFTDFFDHQVRRKKFARQKAYVESRKHGWQ